MLSGERFNSYSHLIGLVLCLAGGALLLEKVVSLGDPARTAGVAIFIAGAAAVYAVSTLFHSTQGPAKRFWRRADHCSVFVLVAATYTPFALATAPGVWGWALLAAVWALALLALGHALIARSSEAPPLARYVALGWLTALAAVPLAARMHGWELVCLLLGALLYTAGTLFYRNPRGWPHAHGVWHLFVVGGTASHFAAVSQAML